MSDARLHRLSAALLLVIVALTAGSGVLLVRSGESLLPVILWAAVIAAAHAIPVPTPSGKPANAAIVPAVGAAVVLPGSLPVIGAVTAGLVGGWIIVRSRARLHPGADAGYGADAVALIVFGFVTSSTLAAASGSALPISWHRLLSIAVGASVWFVVRALVFTWVGAERERFSSRYLWFLALEDWTVALAGLTAGTVFALSWDATGAWAVVIALMTYGFGILALARARATRLTYSQMIRALAQIPEVADLAPRGHSVRTAELAVDVAREMGLHPDEVVDLEYAALMHDVGRITLAEPAVLAAGYTDDDIARRGARIIAEAPHLRAVSEYIRVQHSPYRRPGEAKDPDVPMISKIIKVASAYDQGVFEMRMSPLESLERIHRGSAYDFDPDVAASLRRVLVRRGVIAA